MKPRTIIIIFCILLFTVAVQALNVDSYYGIVAPYFTTPDGKINTSNMTAAPCLYGLGHSVTYIICKDGSTYYAVNGKNGTVSSGTSGGTIVSDAMNATESNGGGIVLLKEGTFTVNGLNWIWSNTKLKGQGIERTTFRTTSGNSINVTTLGVDVDISDLYFSNGVDGDEVGVGIYSALDSGSSYGNRTFDININRVQFKTRLNSIFINNDPSNSEGLGNITIKDSLFNGSSFNTDGTEYPAGQYHVVVLNGHKDSNKTFTIENNRFIMEGRRSDSMSLSISGDSSNGNGKNSTAINGGNIKNNFFDNSTRECLAVSDTTNMVIDSNRMEYCDRVGFYFIRGYRNVIVNNIVNYSLYRAYRIDTSDENTFANNKAFHSGSGDTFAISTGGMTVYDSSNNIIIGNTILADKDAAITLTGTSSNNTIAFNKILGSYNTISFTDLTGSNNQIYQLEQGYFSIPTVIPTNPVNGSMAWNGSYLQVHDGTQWRTAALS